MSAGRVRRDWEGGIATIDVTAQPVAMLSAPIKFLPPVCVCDVPGKRGVAFTILGEPASKANSRQVVRIKGRPAVIKSRKALSYEMHAALQIPPAACVMFTEPVRVTMRIFYATERPDLDESVILDVLQAKFSTRLEGKRRFCVRAGVYVNDRQVREKHIFHHIDRKNPRAEIEVEEIA